MTVTPKNGWENMAPARGYECSVATIKFHSYRHTSPPLVSAVGAKRSRQFRKQCA
jgi:hypothetical protein